MATTSGLLHMTKTPDKRVESTLWKLRVLAGNGRGATWKVACVSVSVSGHKETMKPAVPPAVSYRDRRRR
jgi:hypothetical protein